MNLSMGTGGGYDVGSKAFFFLKGGHESSFSICCFVGCCCQIQIFQTSETAGCFKNDEENKIHVRAKKADQHSTSGKGPATHGPEQSFASLTIATQIRFHLAKKRCQ